MVGNTSKNVFLLESEPLTGLLFAVFLGRGVRSDAFWFDWQPSYKGSPWCFPDRESPNSSSLHVDSTTAAAAETVPGVTTKVSRSGRYPVLPSPMNPANAGPRRFSASWAQQRGHFCLCTQTLGAWATHTMAQVVLQQAGVVSPTPALLKFF